jgi:single-strand DNA-binding protein
MIKIQIVGHLGKDCIVKEVNGKNVINFSVAHSEKYKDAQGIAHERTTWVECAYWTDKTSVAQYLTKGKTVYAEGIPSSDAYSDKNGNPASMLRMRCISIQLLGGGDAPNQQQSTPAAQSSAPATQFDNNAASTASDAIDDLPF